MVKSHPPSGRCFRATVTHFNEAPLAPTRWQVRREPMLTKSHVDGQITRGSQPGGAHNLMAGAARADVSLPLAAGALQHPRAWREPQRLRRQSFAGGLAEAGPRHESAQSVPAGVQVLPAIRGQVASLPRASHFSLTSHSFHSPSTTHMAPCYRGMSGLVVVEVRRKGARLRDVAHGRAVHKSPPSTRFGRKLGGHLCWESIKPKGSEGGVCGRHLERTAGRRGSLPV